MPLAWSPRYTVGSKVGLRAETTVYSISLEIDDPHSLYRVRDKLERVLDRGGTTPIWQCRILSGMAEVGRRCLSLDGGATLTVSIVDEGLVVSLLVGGISKATAGRWRGARYFELDDSAGGLTFNVSIECPVFARATGDAGERLGREIVGILEEVSEEQVRRLTVQKEAAEAAAEAQGDFLRRMSHELRTPLTTVIGSAEMLLESDTEEPREILRWIRDESRHMLRIVDDVLDMGEIQSNVARLRSVSIDIRALVDAVVAEIDTFSHGVHDVHDADEPANRVLVDYADAPARMMTDERKLRVILTHLLANASKFAEQGSIAVTVASRTREDRPGVSFVVSDTGVGVDGAYLGRMFDAFSQMDETVTRKFEGLGLGLAISQGYATLMGGVIEVESTPGKSTTMSLWLPLEN